MSSLYSSIKRPQLLTIITPPPSSLFTYLTKFLSFIPLDSIYTSSKISTFIQTEKHYHSILSAPSQPQDTLISNWTSYLSWSKSLITPLQSDTYRYYIALENFTKSMISEPLCYSNKKVLEYWITYVEQCYDGVDILLYLLKKGICVKNYFIYDSIAICYETKHDFDKANDIYLKGFDNMPDNNEELKRKYKEFELRMEKRILRDVNNSSIDVNKIEREIYEEIKRKCNRNMNKDKLGNKRMKRDVEGYDKEMWVGLLKMKIYSNKVEICDDGNNDYIGNNKYMAVNYGEGPVYVDESCRRNFISKATKLVEVYKLLFNFLNEHDEVFKSNQIQFNLDLKRTMERKPYSWINRKGIDNDEVSTNVNNNYIINDNKQLHQEPYNAISYIEQ